MLHLKVFKRIIKLKMIHYYATSHIFSHLSLLPSSGRINNYVFVPSTVKSIRMRNHYSERLFSEPTSVIRSTQHSPLKSMLTGGHRIFSAEGKSGKQSYRPVSSAWGASWRPRPSTSPRLNTSPPGGFPQRPGPPGRAGLLASQTPLENKEWKE